MPFPFVGKESRPTISFIDHNEVIWKELCAEILNQCWFRKF
jgi:hypothetical protein